MTGKKSVRVQPDAVHAHANRVGDRSEQLSHNASGLHGAGVSGGALGVVGSGAASSATSTAGRYGNAVNKAAQKLGSTSDHLHGTAQNYAEVDRTHAEAFNKIGGPKTTPPTAHGSAKPDTSSITNTQQRGWFDNAKRYLSGIGQQPIPAMNSAGDMIEIKPADLAPPKPLVDAHGNVIGVAFHHGQSLQTVTDWAANDRLHNQTFYLHPGQHDLSEAGKTDQMTSGPHPWLQHPDGTFLVDAHANNSAFKLPTHDGEQVWVHGSIFAHVVANSAPFQQAMQQHRPGAFTLMSCHSGAPGPNGQPAPAASFQEAMSEHFGHTQPVYAPTTVVSTGSTQAVTSSGAHVPIGVMGVNDGGHWEQFPKDSP
jgi:uncharacterized protein YukE